MKTNTINETNISLTNDELREMVELYQSKADTIANEIELLLEKQRIILATLNKFRIQSRGSKENSYSVDWTWVAKISYALKSMNKPMKSKEITDFIFQLDSEIKNDIDPKDKYASSVAATIAQKVDKVYKRIKESEEEGGEYIVGLIEWPDAKFDEKNKGSHFGSLLKS